MAKVITLKSPVDYHINGSVKHYDKGTPYEVDDKVAESNFLKLFISTVEDVPALEAKKTNTKRKAKA